MRTNRVTGERVLEMDYIRKRAAECELAGTVVMHRPGLPVVRQGEWVTAYRDPDDYVLRLYKEDF